MADCRQMLTRPLGYGVNRRYHAVYRRAKEMMGDAHELVLEFGRSPLLWTHPHSMDLALFFMGADVIDVQARLTGDDDPVVEHAYIRFAGGRSAVITTGEGCNVRLHGSDRTLEIHADGSWMQMRSGRGYQLTQEFIPSLPSQSATVTALQELVAGVVISPAEVLTGMQMLFACVESQLCGNLPLRLEEVPDSLRVMGRGVHGYA
jgi:predicted dehydrogenase